MSRPATSLPTIAGHVAWARRRWAHLRGAALARYQERRIVKYAQRHAPFYRTHWAGYDRQHG
jgi:hypothetical protein